MELSTPIPVKSDAVPLQEPIQSKSVQTKSLKNGKLGVFTAILEGLTQNLKQVEIAGEEPFLGSVQGTSKTKGAVAHIDSKRKKDSSQSAGEENVARVPNQRRRQEKDGFSEAESVLVARKIDKQQSEPRHKGSVSSNQTNKKEDAALQNVIANTKTVRASNEELVKTDIVQTLIKTDEPKIAKSTEKEDSRKSAFALPRRNQEGEPVQKTATVQQGSGNTDKESRGRIAEVKGRRRERGNVEVRDLRSWESQQTQEFKGDLKPVTEAKTAEFTVHLASNDMSDTSREGVFRETVHRPQQAFEDLLARELHQNLNNDIVRQAQIMLRDHGEGIIRLALKPESLGNVKIQLKMSENRITGHIIVESNETLKAFEREIQSLEQAFKDSGFEGARLDTALASGNQESGADQHWQGAESIPFFSEQFAASRYDAVSDNADESLFDTGSDLGLSQVNMLV